VLACKRTPIGSSRYYSLRVTDMALSMGTAKRRRSARSTWFGVKTLFRSEARGKPTARDSAYDGTVSLVEERVVLFKARTFETAIKAAEAEARRYAARRHVNPYGQPVVTRYLGACDAFELFDRPGDQAEVFSTTEVVPKRVPDRQIVDQRLGRRVDDRTDKARRRNILNREFSGSVRRDA
jgi:hypothetical protein